MFCSKFGTRYASPNVSKSIKAKALAHNVNLLKRFEEGSERLLEGKIQISNS